MKEKLSDELKSIFAHSRDWLKFEIEYAKLTVAEKITVLMSALVLGAVCLMMGMVVLILLSMAIVEEFSLILSPALSYVCTAGIIALLILLLYIFRAPLLLNPIARFITRLIVKSDNIEE